MHSLLSPLFRRILYPALCLAVSLASAGDSGKWGVGMGAGMVGGLGASLRYKYSEKDELRFRFMPYWLESQYPDDDKNGSTSRDSGFSDKGLISFGGLCLHELAKFKRVKISAFGGGNFLGAYENSNFFESFDEKIDTTTVRMTRHVDKYKETSVLALGGGIGGTYTVWRFDFSMLLGMAAAYDFSREQKRITPSIDVDMIFSL